MTTTTAMTAARPATTTYWKSVKLCLARPDGSAEIHHHDGRVERIASDGRTQWTAGGRETSGKASEAVQVGAVTEFAMPGGTDHSTANQRIHTAPMKAALLFLSLLATFALPVFGEDTPITPENDTVQVFLIDDPTGVELARDHGIQPIAVTDLTILVEGIIAHQRPVRIHHELIDENAADNEVRVLEMEPYSGGAAPQKPSPTLPLRQLVAETERYRAEREVWVRGILEYRNRLEANIDAYVRGLTDAQSTLAERFDEMLLARKGRDFNRSDVSGTILSAHQHLGTEGMRICVLNTDAEDLPGAETGKPSRRNPFTPEELDPGIVLVWVNTSGKPQQEPAFAGLPNPSHHVATMAEAMTLIRQMIGGTEAPPVAESNRGQ